MPIKLSKELRQNIASYIEKYYIPEKEAICCREMEICASEAMMPCAPKALSLEDMLKQADAGFTETLLRLIDQTGKKDSEIYKKANISKQHFSKIRNNPHYQPTKATAIAFALALELDVEQTNDLIGRAGYTLTRSSRFDLIVQYYIEKKNFNIVEINVTLYEFDQTLLGV